jgi:hypothetical protein
MLVALAAALPLSAAEPLQRSLFEMRIIRLRNGPENQRQRAVTFLEKYTTLVKEAGAGAVGAFSSSIAEDGPFLLVITSFKNYADMEACHTKLLASSEYGKARSEWYAGGVPYEREEVRLLRAFNGYPAMTPPPTEGRQSSRIFEFRTYELENDAGLERKIRMFDEGETAIFVRAGMLPVFFGETVFGSDMPSLSYMLGFDDLAAREKAGRVSGADPEWKRLGAAYADVATVPKLTISFVSPLRFSDVR